MARTTKSLPIWLKWDTRTQFTGTDTAFVLVFLIRWEICTDAILSAQIHHDKGYIKKKPLSKQLLAATQKKQNIPVTASQMF